MIILVQMMISREVNVWLRNFPTKFEIKSTLHDFQANKAPNTDGIIADILCHH